MPPAMNPTARDFAWPPLPFDWPSARAVLRRHADVLLLLQGMALLFMAAGAGVFWLAAPWPAKALGACFFIVGAALLVLGTGMNIASCRHDYQHTLLKNHGIDLMARLTDPPEPYQAEEEENLYILHYQYHWQGQPFTGADILDDASLGPQLQPSTPIPIRILAPHPALSTVRQQKLKNLCEINAHDFAHDPHPNPAPPQPD